MLTTSFNRCLLGGVFLSILASAPVCVAEDSNYRSIARQVVYSANGKFFAVSDPKENTTTVFSIKQNMRDKEKIWTLDRSLCNFHVSEDGQILAGLTHEYNHVTLKEKTDQAMKTAPVVVFYKSDGDTKTVMLDRVLKNTKTLKATDDRDQYTWGHVLGFDEDNRLILDTHENRRYWIDPKTGEIVSMKSSIAKE